MAVTGVQKAPVLIKPEVNYRKLEALNYSMLKTWDDNPILFFDQYKLGKSKKDKKSMATTVGDIAHFFVLDCNGSENEFDNNFDKKFVLFEGNKGSGQVFILADTLFEVTEESMDENKNITVSLADRFQEAYNRVINIKTGDGAQKYYKGKDIDKVFDDFEKNGLTYFKTLEANIGKTVVTQVMLDKGKFVGNTVLKDAHTSHIFTGNVHRSFPIQWSYSNSTVCKEIACKSELDLFKIDDKKKLIYPFDLKCTWDNEDGFENTYLRYKYYLQQAFYILALSWYFEHEEEQYADYELLPMQYIAVDTSQNNRRPLIYPCSVKDLKAGLTGFKLGHRSYKGVYQLMEEICFAEENDIWNISKQAYENKGIMSLNFNYE